MKSHANDPRLSHLILNQFNAKSFVPSIGTTTVTAEAGYDKDSTSSALMMMSSEHRVIKNQQGEVLADERYLERSGTRKSTSYRLTPYGEQERQRLGALLQAADR